MTTATRLPTLVLEAQLGQNPGTNYLYLDDTTRGKLDTGTLAPDSLWLDISSYARSFSVSRGRNRATETYKPGTMTVSLKNTDGRFDPENLSSPYVSAGATQLKPMVRVRLRALWGGVYYPLFQGFADAWTCVYPAERKAAECILDCTDAFKVLGKFQAAAASSATGASELTGARVGRVLTAAGWPTSDRNIETGVVTCQATTLAQNALTELQNVADSEGGDLYVSSDGKVTFRQKYARLNASRSTTTQVTFSDDAATVAAGSAVGYTNIVRAGDGDLIRNSVTRANVGGSAQTVTNSTSVSAYLSASDNKTDLVGETDTQALQVAQWISYLFAQWEQRVDSVDVSPASAPSVAWPLMLGLELLDRVSVVRTPPGVSTITSKCFVQGIDWQGDPSNWTCRLSLESATYQDGFFVLDSSTLGKLDTNKLAA